MSGGKGSKPSYNPGLFDAMSSYLKPYTSLPAGMAVQAPQVLSPQQIMMQASGVDSMLPSFLQMNQKTNPLFSSNAAQQAQQSYYNQAIVPQLNEAAAQQFLGGNLGDSNSTFGSTYLGSMAAQGANQAFFSGQQYYDDQLNNLLNERNNYFGNDVQVPETQNALAVQSQLGADQINASQLQGLNNFNLGAAGDISGLMGGLMNAQTAYNAQRTQSMGNLIGGTLGLGLGLGNMATGSLGGSLLGGIGSGMFGGGSSAGSMVPYGSGSFLGTGGYNF